MKTRLSLISAIASSLLLTACDDDDQQDIDPLPPAAFVFHTNFSEESNWQAGFADYPKGKEDEWMLEAQAQAEFELETGGTAMGYRLQSFNKSDDTKMFLKQKVEGLKANAWYELMFKVGLASNVAGQGSCSGIGGSPDALTVKLGAATTEPETIEGSNGTEVYQYLNIDLGQQTQRGLDGMAAGNIGIDNFPNCDTQYDKFGVKTITTEAQSFQVRADDRGEAWVILATDSGFEGLSTIYFTEAAISFTELETIEEAAITIDYTTSSEYSEYVAWDYPVGREAEWEISAEAQAPYLDTTGNLQSGYYMHFYNRSDDTGMFVLTPIKGLIPEASYSATFIAKIATNIGESCAGIGGAPNEVFVKAGAWGEKPSVEIEYSDDSAVGSEDYYRLSMDIGEQSEGGEHAISLGKIGSETFDFCDTEHTRFALANKDHDKQSKVYFETDRNGMAWVYIGIDSGFEGPSTVYLDKLTVELIKL